MPRVPRKYSPIIEARSRRRARRNHGPPVFSLDGVRVDDSRVARRGRGEEGKEDPRHSGAASPEVVGSEQ